MNETLGKSMGRGINEKRQEKYVEVKSLKMSMRSQGDMFYNNSRLYTLYIQYIINIYCEEQSLAPTTPKNSDSHFLSLVYSPLPCGIRPGASIKLIKQSVL